MKRCEFCGKRKKTAATSFNGHYCIDCYEVLIEASKEAIEEIKSQ